VFLAPVGAAIGGAVGSIAGAAKTLGPLISLGSQIAGGVATAAGQRQAYGGAANVAEYNQKVFEQNAQLIEAAAKQTKETNQRRKRAFLSDMKANVYARGLKLEGSPLLLLAESAAELELDIQNEEFNSLIDASRARSQASIYGVEADNYRRAGRTAVRNTGISTAFKIASQY
jgi:hypothetical protein